ncbi:hypothetical protein AVL59_25260 [Streptomyces griseochromogenes]|uniref:Uncharacterized protein n=1 Tax=Streptomyces griseochromogenes TaxID=68214 RepID=A0A1B1B0P2_9ACTN|nr:hypothetical protein AVL59_25260 [Streptomyces griseochromogenes]
MLPVLTVSKEEASPPRPRICANSIKPSVVPALLGGLQGQGFGVLPAHSWGPAPIADGVPRGCSEHHFQMAAQC